MSLVVEEITERKRDEERRVQLLDETERARQAAEAETRAKDEFVAMLAHELRNPLGAITSAIALLERLSRRDDSTAAIRGVIARQTAQLARLVDDLLDVARVTTGKISLDRRAVDLAELVERCVATRRVTGGADRHVLAVDVHPVWIEADRARIAQIVENLLTNALKYTPAGGTVRLAVHPDGNEAVLRVADTGIGIPGDLLPRIFDLFVQADCGLERSHGGLGIGLTLVQRLVALHDGRIVAESDGPGRGSVFTVRLPSIASAVVDPAPAPEPLPAPSRRVLVVEDNRDTRDVMRQFLELAGHTVFEAADGPTAVETALRVSPDVAVIDIGLPGFNGYEVAQRLRSTVEGRCLTLVALTGYGRPEDRQRARNAGFDLHLVKPVDPAALVRTLATAGTEGPLSRRFRL